MSKLSSEDIKDLLNFDVLDTCEKAGVEGLGCLPLVHLHSQLKRTALQLNRDSHNGMKPDAFKALLVELGFKEIFSKDIAKQEPRDKDGDKMFIYWNHKLGILLRFDTFWGYDTVNSANAYFVYTPSRSRDGKNNIDCEGLHHVSGGPFGCPRSAYSVDCREGFRWWLQNARKHGWFSCRWGEANKSRFLWLLDYSESRDDKDKPRGYYQEVNKERISHFPLQVQRAMGYDPNPLKW